MVSKVTDICWPTHNHLDDNWSSHKKKRKDDNCSFQLVPHFSFSFRWQPFSRIPVCHTYRQNRTQARFILWWEERNCSEWSKPLSLSHIVHPTAATEVWLGQLGDYLETKGHNGILVRVHHYTFQIFPWWQLWIGWLVHSIICYPWLFIAYVCSLLKRIQENGEKKILHDWDRKTEEIERNSDSCTMRHLAWFTASLDWDLEPVMTFAFSAI